MSNEMIAAHKAEMVKAIRECDPTAFEKALERFDRNLARTDPWAWKAITGHYPTKADKGED